MELTPDNMNTLLSLLFLISFLIHVSGNNQQLNIALAFKLYFYQTFYDWSECLVLLDPATGRVIDTDNLNKNAAKGTVIKNGVKRNRVANRRSDYISPSGVPLYKLRKRNPFGFGG